jgi:selenocysteine-specific elongation factor
MIVIGTAGHIDHGKSAVVKRLTGTDPDRLPEEKSRQLTIDLGFAFRSLDDGTTVSFVDVPGHERFVKNMIAGAGGIDAVMMVIAADDGWMPQSEEHFQVVRLLGIEHGLIVINKCDIADPEWVDLLEEDIREKVAGSFLGEAPMFRVSAQTGDGFDDLAAHIDSLPSKISTQRDIRKPRLYIDRSFVLLGIGGVVTGTLRGGPLSVGQNITVWPGMSDGKIRSLRANDAEVETAYPGQRTAASFSGIEKEELPRGGAVTASIDQEYFTRRPVLALSISLLDQAAVPLENRRRVVVLIGTAEAEGELRIMGKELITPGEEGIVLFRPDNPTLGLVGDRYIMRLPTPMVTLGGGRILDHLPKLPRRKDYNDYSYLFARADWSLENLVTTELRKVLLASPDRLLAHAAVSSETVDAEVQRLLEEKVLGRFRGRLYHREALEAACERFLNRLEAYLKEHSHLRGIPREQVLQLSPYDNATTAVLLDYLLEKARLIRIGDKYNPSGRTVELKGKIRQAHDEIMGLLEENPYTPPKLADLAGRGKDYREAIKFIVESGEGYKCGADFIFPALVWDEILGFVREHLNETGKLAVADLKERFGVTRKWAIPILEETDRLKTTRRDGDYRVKGTNFES